MGITADLKAMGFTVAADLGIELALAEFAHEVRDHARSIAPVFGDLPPKRDAPKDGEPGDYKDSIQCMPYGPEHWRVYSNDFKAIWIEFGSIHMPEYAVFAKTAAYYGGTGPVVDEGIQAAHGKLRDALDILAKLAVNHGLTEPRSERALSVKGEQPEEIQAAKRAAAHARMGRSSAFRAARRGGGRGRRR